MICDEVLPLIDPLVDNELPTQSIALIMEHIRLCPSCQDAWDGRLNLRERFRKLAELVSIPPAALDRVDNSICQHIHQRLRLAVLRKAGVWVAAAALVLVPLALYTFQQQTKKSEVPVARLKKTTQTPATVDDIISEFRRQKTASSTVAEVDLKRISRDAGFKISRLNLRDWRLTSADVIKVTNHSPCLVRMVYVNKNAEETSTITCYQACKGQIKAIGLNEHNVKDRYICCGKVDELSVVYWPDQELDNLLVSSLSEPDLMDLALHT